MLPNQAVLATPLILELGTQRQANLCVFEASLLYKFQDRLLGYRETLS